MTFSLRGLRTNFELVKKFHHAFGQPDPKNVIIPNDDLIRLRLTSDIDMKNVAKELADLLYVVYGAGANFGLPMDSVFDAVHNSNMSKLGEDGKPIKREDGKILKGPNYRPVDLSWIDRKNSNDNKNV